MVIENLQTSSVPEWLLGPGWYDAWLWQPWVIAVLLALGLAGVVWGVRSLRSGDDSVAPDAALTFGALVGLGTLLAAGPLLVIYVRLTTPNEAIQKSIDLFLIPLEHFLDQLLGNGWLDGALYTWLLMVWGLFTAVLGLTWIFRAIARGPVGATEDCGRGLLDMLGDFARTSPRRVFALAWLAWRESLRRRAWSIFVVFVGLILGAGWFLQADSIHPSQLFIQFVLNWTMYFSLVFALVLSALSLPQDIRERTLHTIVTKPVRKSEVVLGRLLGFTAMGTILLVAIGSLSLLFIWNRLNHTHSLSADSLQAEPLPGQSKPLLRGKSSFEHGHRHEVTIDPSGGATVETIRDHTHELIKEEKNGATVYRLGTSEGFFAARVPIYSRSLSFRDQFGKPQKKGVNTGDEWMYRSFIAGGTAAAGIWTFHIEPADFPESRFPTGIPIEMTIEPFRTHKGDIERGVLGTLWVRNPETLLQMPVANFQAKKFATDTQYIPFTMERRSPDGKGNVTIDFFKDIVGKKTGTFEVGLQCAERAQYFGMAQADLYIRAADTWFAWNFFKGYVGIWLQMVMILAIGLFLSTFLSGPVGILGTLSSMILGWFRPFIYGLAMATIVGGGPFESLMRMMTQDNQISPLQSGISSNAAVEVDKVARIFLHAVEAVLPPFADFDFVTHVAFGFDINLAMLTKCLLSEAAYVVPVIVLGYLCLRAREIAR